MFTITSQSLAQFIQKQLDLYFTDFHKDELEKKILEMTTTIEHLIPEIIKIDPSQMDKFDGWNKNPSILKNSLSQLDQLKPKSCVIDRIILQLKKVLSNREELFLSKTIGMTDWNMNKDYLSDKLSLLKDEIGDKILTCEEIITFLNLSPLNQCTSELGYYKAFAQGIDEEGKSFTKIFYFLKSDEKSYFHKLDTTETWTWLGKSPLSLFIIENNQLTKHVLTESNQCVTIPNQTWFSAAIKNDERNLAKDDIPFTLVTCHCIPAFTINCYHDDIIHDEASTSLINAYKIVDSEMQSNIVELIAPQYQPQFEEKLCL